MLDERLTSDERHALLHLLTKVALTDGRLTDAEVKFVQRIGLPIGLAVGDLLALADDVSLDEVCARLRRPHAARVTVLELLRLAHVDGTYAKVEQRSIIALAHSVGVDTETVAAIEDWVRREWSMLREVRALLDPER